MDAEKRHQLKTNELAEALSKLRDFGNDPQTRYLLLAVVVIIAIVIGWRVWSSRQESALADGLLELTRIETKLQTDTASGIEALRALAAGTSSPALAANARIRMAAALRQQANSQPNERENLLRQSVETLKRVVDDPAAPAPLVAAATFSLGTSYESLRRFDEAAAAYEQIADERFAGSPFVEPAAKRLESIDELRVPVKFEPGLPTPSIPEPVATPEAPRPTSPPSPAPGEADSDAAESRPEPLATQPTPEASSDESP